ncbi:MAG: DNA polymerase III subunit beta, partial [Planctomycetota bacterium]
VSWGRGLRLATTPLTKLIALHITVPQVQVREPGEALIPADKLKQIISAEDNEATLTLETDGETCHIKGVDAHFKVYGYPPGEFPPVPDFQAASTGAGGGPPAKSVFSAEAGTLNLLVDRTLFATARENSRYAINGVLMKRDGRKVEMVATDGRRLALCKAQLAASEKDGDPASCIIPNKALTLLSRLLGTNNEPVHVAITDSQALFNIGAPEPSATGRATLSTNLVDGNFPPYEDVIPRDQDKKITFDRDVLFSGVKRAALLTNEESRGVRLAFDGKGKRVELTSRAPEMGEAQITLDVAEYDGDDVEIGFNPGFILEALRVIPDTQVLMELKASNKPGLIRLVFHNQNRNNPFTSG